MSQQPDQEAPEVIEAEITSPSLSPTTPHSGSRNPLFVGIGLGVLGFLLSWLFALPSIQSDYPIAGLIPVAILGGSFYVVWNSIDRKMVGVLAVVYLLMASSPFIASSMSTSSITIAESTLSSDSTEITLKIRQSGGFMSSSIDSADVSISYDGSEVWSHNTNFAIDREDGYGKYGQFTLTVSDFYLGNAVSGQDYVVTVIAGGSEDSHTLESSLLIRTVDDAQNEANGYMGTGADCDSNTENCVIGVILTSWIGYQAVGNNKPGGMPFANYNVTATLMEGSEVAVQYPLITVQNGQASWDDSNGDYGSGSAIVGDFGSDLPMDGSLSAPEFERMYIPTDDFQSAGEYGCYSFVVEVSQAAPWTAPSIVTDTTYYEYDKTGDTESWDLVNNC
tara:strand:+ start:80 stop:1255 length:1176 start_codon:yes stop_codon:yes gene_type:complete